MQRSAMQIALSAPYTYAVPRLSVPDLSLFRREYLLPGRPLVITDAIGHWPAFQRWTIASIARQYATRQAPCYLLRNGEIVLDSREGLLMDEIPVSEFVREMESGGERRHRIRADMEKSFPELLADVEVPDYCRNGLALEKFFWVTPQGLNTALHWDMPENLYAQISGRKRFILYSPEDTALIYPYPKLSTTPQFSRVDVSAPDYENFPLFRYVRAWECTLEPGDMLYMPTGWWHYAESPTTTISVNFWWLRLSLLPKAVINGAPKWIRGKNY
jgi:hypothetical protein